MSRIGKQPVPVPPGSTCRSTARTSRSRVPRAPWSWRWPNRSRCRGDDGAIVVAWPDDERRNRSLHGLSRTPGGQPRHRCHRRLHHQDGDLRRRLPRGGQGQQPRVRPRLQPSGADQRPRGCHVRGGDADEVLDLRYRQAEGRPDRGEHPPPAQERPYKGKGIRYEGEQIRRKVGKTGK